MKRRFWLLPLLLAVWVPSVALASGGEHSEGGIPWSFIAFHCLNLAILVFGIWYLARRSISDTLRNRSAGVRRAIEEALSARDKAERRMQEVETRMADFNRQVEEIQRQAREAAEREREFIVAQAEREIEVIRQSGQVTIHDEVSRAKRVLLEEAVEIAIRLAHETLRQQVTFGDQQRLARELVERLEQEPATTGRKYDGA